MMAQLVMKPWVQHQTPECFWNMFLLKVWHVMFGTLWGRLLGHAWEIVRWIVGGCLEDFRDAVGGKTHKARIKQLYKHVC